MNTAPYCNAAYADALSWGLQNKDDSVSSESKSPWSVFPKPVVYVIVTCLAFGAVATGSSALVKFGNFTRISDRLTGVETRMDVFDKARQASDEKLDRFIWQYEQFRNMDLKADEVFSRKLDDILKSINGIASTVTSVQMDASTRNVSIESRLNSIKEQSLNAFDIANELSKRVSDVELHQAVEGKKP